MAKFIKTEFEGLIMNKEDIIVEKITQKLKQKLSQNQKLSKKIVIDSHVNVLKDITIMPNIRKRKSNDPRFVLTFGDAEQDIVVYFKDAKIEIPFDSKYIQKARRSFPNKSIKHFNYVIIPLIIFEIKYGKVITHTLTNYSAISQQIKDKNPDTTYCIVLINNPDSSIEKQLRHGRHFDWIIPLSVSFELSNDDIERIAENIYERICAILKYRTPLLFS